MVQMNPTVGDLEGNVQAITRWMNEARKAKADVVVFPELAITGYPPEDLVLRTGFLRKASQAIDQLVTECRGLAAVVGCITTGGVRRHSVKNPTVVPSGRHTMHNAAAIMADGRLVSIYSKMILPNYGVFDESRYFHPGRRSPVFVLNGTVFGVTICEDMWYPEGPTQAQAHKGGAEVMININASPFHREKSQIREQMLATRARENKVIVCYTNMVGGQDELVFDGNSLIVDHTGQVILRGKAFVEDLLIADLDSDAVARSRGARGTQRRMDRGRMNAVERIVISERYHPKTRRRAVGRGSRALGPLEEVYKALVVGVCDYVKKNRFRKVVIALSGGIDSALTAVVARDAVGATNVLGIFMPSPYTSRESVEDVGTLARGLGIKLIKIPISGLLKAYLKLLTPSFVGREADTTEENLQARIRGNILMALSNKFGHLVLTTGNKSEMSVGYATLYGDMAGGFAVIKDVPKTLVYDLANWRNEQRGTQFASQVIPQRIIERAPSAELKANQTDQDTLPPYAILDAILKAYIEEDRSPEDIVTMGFERQTVKKVVTMVDQSEYKRRQAPIGIKITQRALGKDRRMPITNRYLSG